MKPTLVILAAGMGSRFGGLKQIEPLGNNGETIIDFSIFDAIEAGFKRLILIIRKEHEAAFEKVLVAKIRPFIEVDYAYQSLDDVPSDFTVPENREKPWGTTHALLCVRDLIKEDPFMVINADDYYGKESYRKMYEFLTTKASDGNYAMMGYIIDNTLSDHGFVTRAICQMNQEKQLAEIVEVSKIGRKDGQVIYEKDNRFLPLAKDSIVSMNYWGFTPAIFADLKPLWHAFCQNDVGANPLKAECLLPTSIQQLINQKKAVVHVLPTSEKWIGVTYKEDAPLAKAAFLRFKEQGLYPFDLWEKVQ